MSEELEYKYTSLRIAVSAMRDAQKAYFKTRGTNWLMLSKKLEKQVDELLSQK